MFKPIGYLAPQGKWKRIIVEMNDANQFRLFDTQKKAPFCEHLLSAEQIGCQLFVEENKVSCPECIYKHEHSITEISTNIQKSTIQNDKFRDTIYTSESMQIVLQNLRPGQIIAREMHKRSDQFIRVEKGEGLVNLYNKEDKKRPSKTVHLTPGSMFVVPRYTEHEIQNVSNSNLHFYTIYSPPMHPPHLIEYQEETTITNILDAVSPITAKLAIKGANKPSEKYAAPGTEIALADTTDGGYCLGGETYAVEVDECDEGLMIFAPMDCRITDWSPKTNQDNVTRITFELPEIENPNKVLKNTILIGASQTYIKWENLKWERDRKKEERTKQHPMYKDSDIKFHYAEVKAKEKVATLLFMDPDKKPEIELDINLYNKEGEEKRNFTLVSLERLSNVEAGKSILFERANGLIDEFCKIHPVHAPKLSRKNSKQREMTRL